MDMAKLILKLVAYDMDEATPMERKRQLVEDQGGEYELFSRMAKRAYRSERERMEAKYEKKLRKARRAQEAAEDKVVTLEPGLSGHANLKHKLITEMASHVGSIARKRLHSRLNRKSDSGPYLA